MKNTMVCVVALGLLSSVAIANDEVLQQDPINIDGYVKADTEVTDRELEMINNELTKQKTTIKLNKKKSKQYQKLQNTTEKLAENTEEYIAEKKASQEAIDKYNKKINCLMNNVNSAECNKILGKKMEEDTVSVQAAAVEKTEVAVEAPKKKGTIRLTPFTGINSYQIDNGNLESELVFGIKGEGKINEKFSAGAIFQYTRMTSEYFDTNRLQTYFGMSSLTLQYTQMEFGAYGKFTPLTGSNIKPYALAGASYVRLNLSADNANSIWNTDNQSANYAMGRIAAGIDFDFTDSVGLNIEGSYNRAILKREVAMPVLSNNPDEYILNDEVNALQDTDVYSFNVGLSVLF